jgi:hypothetical protein
LKDFLTQPFHFVLFINEIFCYAQILQLPTAILMQCQSLLMLPQNALAYFKYGSEEFRVSFASLKETLHFKTFRRTRQIVFDTLRVNANSGTTILKAVEGCSAICVDS